MYKKTIGANIGNILEWYDYILYGYLAPIFAMQFFPAKNHYTALFAAFATFAVGYLSRPLGGIVFGHIGDRYSRALAIKITFPIMMCCTLLLGLMPTYQHIGIWAPILLTVLRLLQGFSAGGQSTGTYVYISEHSPAGKRGLHVGIAWSTLTLGILLGSLVCLAAFNWAPKSHYILAWRIPYLLSIIFAIVWWFYRKAIIDNDVIETKQQAHLPIYTLLTQYWRPLLQSIVITSFPSIAYYMLLIFGVTFLNLHGHLSLVESMSITAVGMALGIILVPFIGLCSDKIGRKPIMLFGAFCMLILSWPIFHMLTWGYYWVSLIGIMLLMVCKDLYAGPGITKATELFPKRIRFTGFAMAWNIANGVFGGTVPLISLWLIHHFKSPIAPSYYLLGFSALAFFVTLGLKQSKG